MALKSRRSPLNSETSVRNFQNDLSQLDSEIKTAIRQLSSECSSGSKQELNRRAQKIRERLAYFDGKLSDFEQLINSNAGGAENSEEHLSKLDHYRFESRSNLQNLRRAVIGASQSIEEAERRRLLSGESSTVTRRATPAGGSGGMASESSEVTENLTALVRQMDQQVRQSESTLTALVGSSQALDETEKEFGDMGATIQSSGKLLSKYGRRECTDKLLICLALIFFFATAFYIAKKRVLNRMF